MKKIFDRELTITISNRKLRYKGKLGYLTFDEDGRNIGIVYMADDKRKAHYGSAEILFYKDYETEFGTWRLIKQVDNNLQNLKYSQLERIIEENQSHTVTTASRLR